jgi:hypothetical protein
MAAEKKKTLQSGGFNRQMFDVNGTTNAPQQRVTDPLSVVKKMTVFDAIARAARLARRTPIAASIWVSVPR